MRIASQDLLFVIDRLLGYAGADTDALPAGGVLHVTAASQRERPIGIQPKSKILERNSWPIACWRGGSLRS